MGEIAINPIHNVHKKYREMNFVNPYIFAPPVDLSTNTEIGGVASTISTPALLATKLGIDVSRITNFSTVGSDIKCKITGSYVIPTSAFLNDTSILYYYDNDNLVSDLLSQSFRGTINLKIGIFNGIVTLTGGYIFREVSSDAYISLKNCTSITSNAFDEFLNKNGGIYLPNATVLGSTTLSNNVFNGQGSNVIYLNSFLQTSNSGAEEGDVALARSQGSTIRYVANLTLPNSVTTLASGTIYNTAIQLNFTPPIGSTNAIDFYEAYLNGVLYPQKIIASGQYLTGLIPSTSYNITLKAVDVFYNKSAVSNSLSVSTTNNATDIATGLVSYYKLDGNSNNSFGSNNGVDTSVSYVSGKIVNAGSYNGTASKTIIGNPANLQLSIGTISCWIKTSGAGSSYRGIFGKIEAYTMFLFDGVLGVYNWGSFGGSGLKTTGVNLNDGIWHHLVFVFDSGTANNKIYIDGILRLTFSMSVLNQTKDVVIGYGGGSNLQFINGLIDEASIYNTKLTQSDINLLYNSGNGITL